MRPLLPLLVALLAGCAADPAPRGREPAPIPDPPAPPPPTVVSGAEVANQRSSVDLTSPAVAGWEDPTTGDAATLVYVTERGRRDQAQAAAIVISSDPGNPHFQRTSTARVTVQRVTRADMSALLRDLSALGLERLPWAAQGFDAPIGPERALYLYRGGQRTRVEKDALPDAARQTFTALERRLIQATLATR
ncbi:MAG: hypothetical protein M9894_23145 [Planctomycetes bacterium]|nr:hypothetical protein [Planctomycetota bacterium]